MIALLLLGCGFDPFGNDPPKLVSFNGVPYNSLFQTFVSDPEGALQVTPGEDYEIALEIDDPENQHVRVWFPWAPEGLDFDPDGTTGVWHDPEPPGQGLVLLLEDSNKHDPRTTEVDVPLWIPSDTGDTGFPPWR